MLVSIIVFNSANAESWKDRRSKLDKSYIKNEFRIFYSLNGRDALPKNRHIDKNKNGVPDFIDEVSKRLIKSKRFFVKEIGLRPPLRSKRYVSRANYIDINILDFSRNKTGPKNGVAYDGTPKFNRDVTGDISTNVLAIDLSGSVKLKTNSVEHELFHLFQNGYTYFKNRWYTEGTARWSEVIILNRIGRSDKLPETSADVAKLYSKTYKASLFWNDIIKISDRGNLGKRYIKELLEQLDYFDNRVARKRGIRSKDWKEVEQRSKGNDKYILLAAIEAVRKVNKQAYEEESIQRLIDL
jgi:hypothetical protein